MAEENNKPTKKQIILDLPWELYERFLKSHFRRDSNTDAEAFRAALKEAMKSTEGII